MKQDKQKPIFGLDKIPDTAYVDILKEEIKELQIQSGKDKMYIAELEYNLNKLRELTPEELTKCKYDIHVKVHYQEVAKLKKHIKDLEYKAKQEAKNYKKKISQIINTKITKDGNKQ